MRETIDLDLDAVADAVDAHDPGRVLDLIGDFPFCLLELQSDGDDDSSAALVVDYDGVQSLAVFSNEVSAAEVAQEFIPEDQEEVDAFYLEGKFIFENLPAEHGFVIDAADDMAVLIDVELVSQIRRLAASQ